MFLKNILFLKENGLINDEPKLGSIIEPDPIPFTMDSIGWKILFILLFISILFFVLKKYKEYKKNTYRRDAIDEINSIISDSDLNVSIKIEKTLFILKQTALISYSRIKTASLKGESWLVFLDDTSKYNGFKQYNTLVTNAVYKNVVEEGDKNKVNSFLELSKNWIKNHA